MDAYTANSIWLLVRCAGELTLMVYSNAPENDKRERRSGKGDGIRLVDSVFGRRQVLEASFNKRLPF